MSFWRPGWKQMGEKSLRKKTKLNSWHWLPLKPPPNSWVTFVAMHVSKPNPTFLPISSTERERAKCWRVSLRVSSKCSDMQKPAKSKTKGNVNPQQAFYQVTWVTGIIINLCYLAVTHLSTSYPEILSAIFPDLIVNLLMAVLMNIYIHVNVVKGTSFPSVFVWLAYCHCTEWAPLCIMKKKNKRDFVFALVFVVFSVFVVSFISMMKGRWIWQYICLFLWWIKKQTGMFSCGSTILPSYHYTWLFKSSHWDGSSILAACSGWWED